MALTTVPASLSATALTLTTAAQPNITSVGTLTGLTVSGNIAGTLTTAAQTNITSVGTLTGLTLSGVIGGSAGSASAPSLSFSGDPNTGLYSLAADNLGFAIAGVARAFMSATQFNMTGNIIASGNLGGTLTTAAQTNITSVGTLTSLTSGAHLINASSSAFGGSSVQGFNTDFLVDTGQGYSRHNSYHTGGSNHQFLVNATGSTTNTVALSINKDANATFAGKATVNGGNLEVFGANRKVAVGESGSGGTFGFMGWDDTNNYLYLGNSYSSAFNTDLVIDNTGQVGIGTTNPDWALDVRGANSGVQLQLGRSVGGSTGTAWFGADGTGLHIGPGTYSSGGYSVGAPALKLDTSGHFGLSTIPPSHASLGTLASVNAMNVIGVSTSGGYVGYNTYYNSSWKYQVAAGSALLSFANNGDVTLRQATSGSQNAAISYTETLHIDNAGKVGIGIDPTHPIDLRAQYQPSGGVALNLHTDGGAWIQQKSTLSGVGSYQIGPGGDDWCVYDNTSSEYQIRVRDNATHKGSLQHKCHATFEPHAGSSDTGQDEKGAFAGAVYRLHNARIAPGQYSNGYYYVGVGRHYNKSTAFVEFKVNYVKASTAKCSFTANNSADSQTRRAQLYWSLDGRRYSQVASTSFGSGQATASYQLTTNMIYNTDSTFTGSIYWRCYLIDNASVHETLIGWRGFTFEAFAESMTFDGGFEQGVPDARKDQVTRAYGNTAGTEINYVPTSRPYGHTFTGATNVAVSSNAAYQQFTNKNYGYLNEDLMQIVTTPVHGIQILAEGQIMYSFNQDMITAGSTSYAYCQVRRHDYNNSNSAILGYHLITNTNGQWDMMTGQGIFDVAAGDIISFYFGASNITNMDGGSWSYYNILWWPVTVTGTGNVGTGLPWAGETAS